MPTLPVCTPPMDWATQNVIPTPGPLTAHPVEVDRWARNRYSPLTDQLLAKAHSMPPPPTPNACVLLALVTSVAPPHGAVTQVSLKLELTFAKPTPPLA